MRQSQLFTKTRKEAPSDETSKNAQLLIRAGFVHKEMAGVYSYLPLGFRVLSKLITIVREEINAIGGVEMMMSELQPSELYKKTNRWDDNVVDVWFKTKLNGGEELGLAFTHDEMLTHILREHVSSYRDLPRYIYHFQTKFRNELRAKSGIMRGREFLMKDLYSFDTSQEGLDKFYEQCIEAYMKVFKRCGIGDKTFLTFASGGTFAKYSHEFQTLSESGEDIIYLHETKRLAINKEVLTSEVLDDLKISRGDLVEKKSIEVGNIFKQSTRFPDAAGLTYLDDKGEQKSIYMGGYGIGMTRLMGTIVELMSDDKGIMWPKEVSPFVVHLVRLGVNPEVVSFADKIYFDLQKKGIDVLYDDRDARPGEKFADSDLIGIPARFIVSDKTVAENKVEVKYRNKSESELFSVEDALKVI